MRTEVVLGRDVEFLNVLLWWSSFFFYSSHLLLNVFPDNKVKKIIVSILPCSFQSAKTTFNLCEIVSVTTVTCPHVKTPSLGA